MAIIRVDGIGVGGYDANQTIQAEDYFKASGGKKIENGTGGFSIGEVNNGDFLVFNNISGLRDKNRMLINATAHGNSEIEIRKDSPEGELIKTFKFRDNIKTNGTFEIQELKFEDTKNLCFLFRGNGTKLLVFDSFSFK
jgi:hypothetical protein